MSRSLGSAVNIISESWHRPLQVGVDKCLLCSLIFSNVEETSSGQKVKHDFNVNRKLKLTADKIKEINQIPGISVVGKTKQDGICVNCYRKVHNVVKKENNLKKNKQMLLDAFLTQKTNVKPTPCMPVKEDLLPIAGPTGEVLEKTKPASESKQNEQVEGTEETPGLDMSSENCTTENETGAIQVTATIKTETLESIETHTTETYKELKETNSNHFKDILSNLRREPDLSIYAICGKRKQVVTANKCVLEASSSEFKRIFKLDNQKQPYKNLVFELDNRGFGITDFVNMIAFIYTGKIKLTFESVENILRAAGYFKIWSLINVCEEYLKSVLNNVNCVELFMILCKNETAVALSESLGGVKKALKEYIGLYAHGLLKDNMIYKYSTEEIMLLLQNNCLKDLKDVNMTYQFARNMLDRCPEPDPQTHQVKEDCSNIPAPAKVAKIAIALLMKDLGTMFVSQKKSLYAAMVSLQNRAEKHYGIMNLFDGALTKLSQSLDISNVLPRIEPATNLLFTPVTISACSQDGIKVVLLNKNIASGNSDVVAADNENKETADSFKKELKVKSINKEEGSNINVTETKNRETSGRVGFETSDVEKDVSGKFNESLLESNSEKVIEINETSTGTSEQITDLGYKTDEGVSETEEVHAVIENIKVEPDESWTQSFKVENASVQGYESLKRMPSLESTGPSNVFGSERNSYERRKLNQSSYDNNSEKGNCETQIKVEKINDDGTVDHFVIQTQNQYQSQGSKSDFGHKMCDDFEHSIPIMVKHKQPDKSTFEDTDHMKSVVELEQTSVKKIHTNKSIVYADCNVPVERYYSPSEKRKKTTKLPATIKKQKLGEQKPIIPKLSKGQEDLGHKSIAEDQKKETEFGTKVMLNQKHEEQKPNVPDQVKDKEDLGHVSKGQGQTKEPNSVTKVMLIPKNRLKKVVKKS